MEAGVNVRGAGEEEEGFYSHHIHASPSILLLTMIGKHLNSEQTLDFSF